MRSAHMTQTQLRIRVAFWFALADLIAGYEIAGHGLSRLTLRRRIAAAAYNRGCEWQERLLSRNVRLLKESNQRQQPA